MTEAFMHGLAFWTAFIITDVVYTIGKGYFKANRAKAVRRQRYQYKKVSHG